MTRSLWNSWPEVKSSLDPSKTLLACFDYDGTLTPIVPTPEEAIATPEVRQALQELASLSGVVVGIVSGRPLYSLVNLVPADPLWLIGHHGLSLRSPEGETSSMVDEEEAKRALEPLREAASLMAAAAPGLRLEDKGSGLAMHVRNASRDAAAEAAEAFCQEAKKLEGFALLHGKEVYEVRPAGIDKGKAVMGLRQRAAPNSQVLYVGDDTTDEDAFRALASITGSLTVKVGDEGAESEAEYRVDDPDDVLMLLRRLIELRSAGS